MPPENTRSSKDSAKPAPPPEPADASPPPPEPEASPPPPSEAEPPAQPPAPTGCEVCAARLPASSRSGLCLNCRFKHGDPFRPVRHILYCDKLAMSGTTVVDVKLFGILDSIGNLPTGLAVEARCLRIDAPEWRYELGHSWPSGMSVFVDDKRALVKRPDEENFEFSGPYDLTPYFTRTPLQIRCGAQPRHTVKFGLAINAKRSEQWALGICVVERWSNHQILETIKGMQVAPEARMQVDLERIHSWVTAHRPDRVAKGDQLRCVEPPVVNLVCCTSLCRIDHAARGAECDHLKCFDLASYVHTMRNIPPKHAWCCPVCDKPAPVHRLRLDAFAQSVLDSTQANVTEVLVADSGKWEVSAVEEPLEDDSDDDGVQLHYGNDREPTQKDLQNAAFNLGRASSAPVAAPVAPKKADKAPPTKPQEKGAPAKRALEEGEVVEDEDEEDARPKESAKKKKKKGKKEEDEPVSEKMLAWQKLQGIRKEPEPKPEEPKVEEPVVEMPKFGWMPQGAVCSKCDKKVAEKGGVLCGRKLADGTLRGCHAGVCWKCMNKAGKEKATFGTIRTSKAEFAELGDDAWWMHEPCMSADDKRTYFGEEDEDDVGKPKDMDDDDDEDDGKKFAWE